MAIIYPVSPPTLLKFKTANWQANDTTSEAVSPYTAQSQVIVYPAQWWNCDLTLVAMRRADYERWNAFLLSLRGRSGSFLLGDPLAALPRGYARMVAGTPLVNGVGQTGDSLAIDGAPHSITGWLKSGDYIQLGAGTTARLHKLVEDASTNTAGQATLSIWPDLRESPADNAAVVVSGAVGVFKRTTDQQAWQTDATGTASITFSVKEVL